MVQSGFPQTVRSLVLVGGSLRGGSLRRRRRAERAREPTQLRGDDMALHLSSWVYGTMGKLDRIRAVEEVI